MYKDWVSWSLMIWPWEKLRCLGWDVGFTFNKNVWIYLIWTYFMTNKSDKQNLDNGYLDTACKQKQV